MRYSLTLALLFFFVSVAFAARRSAAELFNGSYYFINSTRLDANGNFVLGRDETLGPLLGNIMYAPAYPGALFGNMTVAYGNDLPQNTSCATALEQFSGYTGPYEVFPNGTAENPWPFVLHNPIITNNPINGRTPKGPAVRYYDTYDNDNLLRINAARPPGVSYLYWRRNFPFPAGPACTLSASVVKSGEGWIDQGTFYQQYSLNIQNTGESSVISTQVAINLAPGQTIINAWNIEHVSGNIYSVPIYSPIAVGGAVSTAGFIVSGTGIIYVGVPTSSTTCTN